MLVAMLSVLAGFVAAALIGGGTRSRPPLRATGLLLVGAALEAAGSAWATGTTGLALIIAGFAALVLFALANLKIPGMLLVAAGLAANLGVICIDSGMPVRGVAAGDTIGARHHAQRPSDRLTGLGDVIPLAPLGETVSAGDIVIYLGVAVVTATLAAPLFPRRRRRRALTP